MNETEIKKWNHALVRFNYDNDRLNIPGVKLNSFGFQAPKHHHLRVLYSCMRLAA